MMDAPIKLSGRLRALADLFEGRKVSLGAVIAGAEEHAYDLILVLLTLPFLSPVPVPMLSTAFGAVIALIGLRRGFGRPPALPARLMRAELPPKFLHGALAAASALLKLMERFLRPRLSGFAESSRWRVINGLVIGVCGLLLLLPLPIPFSNFLPAASALLLAAGTLERDGRAILAAHGVFGATLIFFGGIAAGGCALVDRAWGWLAS